MWQSPTARNVAGYLAAVAAAATLNVVTPMVFAGWFPHILELWLSYAAAVAIVALVPTWVVVHYAETRAIRSIRYFALCGAGVGTLIGVLVGTWLLPLVGLTGLLRLVANMGAGGLAGGLTFWVVSGRFAGAKGNGQTQV